MTEIDDYEPQGFMGIVISQHPFLISASNGDLVMRFDVRIEKGDRLIKRTVLADEIIFGNVRDKIRFGQELFIFGIEHLSRRPNSFDTVRARIIAKEIEFPNQPS